MNTHDRIELPPLPYPYDTTAYRTVGAVIQEYARAAIKADRKRRGEPEGWQLVPVEPDCDMAQAGVNLALSARISGAYPWPTYIQDMYKAMLAAAPQPDHIPDVTKMVEPTGAEILDLLIEMRRELHACQAVIHLAGGFDPAYVNGALAAINKADIVIKAMRGEE